MISPIVARRLRIARGWSQDQLATASGVSLRTIQRVESAGTTSLETRLSLAATFGIPIAELSQGADGEKGSLDNRTLVGSLLVGMTTLTCVMLIASVPLPQSPMSTFLAAINIFLGMVGALLTAPAAFKLVARGYYGGVILAVLGTPLAGILAAGLIYALSSGRTPDWPLFVFGLSGLALLGMGLRSIGRRT